VPQVPEVRLVPEVPPVARGPDAAELAARWMAAATQVRRAPGLGAASAARRVSAAA